MYISSKLLFNLIYNGPIFVLFVVWLLLRARDRSRLTPLRVLIDAFVVAISASRFLGVTIPPSGHAVFLAHSLITVNNKWYRVIALVILLLTIGLKISWKDHTSWAYGILVGLGCGAIWVYSSRRCLAPLS